MSGFAVNELSGLSDVLLGDAANGTGLAYDTNSKKFKASERYWNCGTTPTIAIALRNLSVSTVTVQEQYGPGLLFGGHAWDDDGAVNVSHDWLNYVKVESGNTVTSEWTLAQRVDAGIWTTRARLSNTGTLTVTTLNVSANVAAEAGYVSALKLYVKGDSGAGASGYTQMTNVLDAGDATGATLGNTPTGIAAGQTGWIKFWAGTSIAWVPYWGTAA
jgi:hypothetical protein